MDSNTWKKYASAYNKVMPLTSFYQELLEKTVESLNSCNVILDIGVGPGILVKRLAEQGKKVYGIDKNEIMLSYAKKEISKNSNKNKIFLDKQDARNLKFSDEFFDGVACINVLFYINNPYKVLKEAHRVLKKDGIFIISGPKPNYDLKSLEKNAIKKFILKGIYYELRKDISVVNECTKKLSSTSSKNTYSTKKLENILLNDISFERIIKSDEDTFLGQSYFVMAKK